MLTGKHHMSIIAINRPIPIEERVGITRQSDNGSNDRMVSNHSSSNTTVVTTGPENSKSASLMGRRGERCGPHRHSATCGLQGEYE